MIIPRAKEEKYEAGRLSLGKTVSYYSADCKGQAAAALLREFVPEISFVAAKDAASADFVFTADHTDCTKDEEYTVVCGGQRPVRVHYRDFSGARNASATIAQLLKKTDGGFAFPVCAVRDWPDFPMRSLMLDPARCLIPLNDLKDTLLRMAEAKYNYMHFHLSDSSGYAIRSDLITWGGPHGKQYTKAEIREIVAYAAHLGITIIPEVEFPGHSTLLLKEHPEFACVTDGSEAPSPWAACAGNEAYYDFLKDLYTELAQLFPGPIIHVGTDEIEMNDLTERRTWPTWHCCSRCRELCEREGIDPDSRTEIFYYMLRRVYGIITGLGRRMMMWNDNIDISGSPDLPRDILIQFWRVAGTNRGPVEGCSMQRFLEEGFEVFNSWYPETYIERDFYPNTDDTIRVWTPRTTPVHDAKYDGQILGGEACAWGESARELSHFAWTLPSSLMLYADRLWTAAVCDDLAAFAVAGTRYQLGVETPEGFDLFTPFGGFMQPRSVEGVRMWEKKAADDLDGVDAVLAGLEKPWLLTGRLAAEYRRSIAWLKEKRSQSAAAEGDDK